MKALREKIVGCLDGLLTGRGVRQAQVACPTRELHDAHALRMDHPRLVLTAKGTRYHRCVDADGAAVEVPVRAGEALFVAPDAPLVVYYLGSAVVLHVNLCDTLTLFKWAEYDRARDGRGEGPDYDFHARGVLTVNRGLDAEGMQLCGLLGASRPGPYAGRYVGDLTNALLTRVRGLLDPLPRQAQAGKASNTWQAVCRHVHEHCTAPIDRRTVAEAFRLHPNHLSRLFREHGRQGFTAYLNAERIERAKALLLRHPELNVGEIAHVSGFASAHHFHKVFRARVRTSPTRYRTLHAGDPPRGPRPRQ